VKARFSFFWSCLGLCLLALQGVQAALPSSLGDGTELPSLAPMLENVSPAVVNIATYGRVRTHNNPLMEDPFSRHFFNLPKDYGQQERRTRSAGSGVIVDATRGYVLTNAHVVKQAEQVEVVLVDGTTLAAEVVGTDEQVDLAVLKVPSQNLVDIVIADSTDLKVGDFVVAIGNPFGLGQTVTSGIVSALGRTGLRLNGFENYIQTDASINPGNSGGALVNLKGELVGINTAIIAPAGGNVGIGFAIPTEMVSLVMQQLIDYGEVRRGVLGVKVQDVTAELAEAFSLEQKQGVVVSQVIKGSAAEKAGIKAGDVVLSVDGKPVLRASDLRNRVGLSTAGEKVVLEVLREGKKRSVEAVIIASTAAKESGETFSPHLSGASLVDVEAEELTYAEAGVMLQEVQRGSPAWRAGLREKDVIVNANRQEVVDMASLKAAINKDARTLMLRIVRENGSFFVVLR